MFSFLIKYKTFLLDFNSFSKKIKKISKVKFTEFNQNITNSIILSIKIKLKISTLVLITSIKFPI